MSSCDPLRPPSASTLPWRSWAAPRPAPRVRVRTGGGRAGWTVPAGRLRVGRAEWGPRSYHELLFQLLGAGRLVLQGPAGEGAPGGAQEVQGDLPGRVHGADGLHGAQGLHVQHEGHARAPPAGTDSRAGGVHSASRALPSARARGPGNSGARPLRWVPPPSPTAGRPRAQLLAPAVTSPHPTARPRTDPDPSRSPSNQPGV